MQIILLQKDFSNRAFFESLCTSPIYFITHMMLQIFCLLPGDEILSINGRQVEGMTDMEALALLAKAGPTVLLEVVKHAFLWRRM